MNIDKDIKKASTPSSSFYTSKKIFNKTKSVFENSYQYICHESELLENTNIPFYLLENWLDIPLVVTKEKNKIYCLSNVCTHRGNIICNKKNNQKKLVCNYHGRSFNLDGSINHAPGFKETKNFPSKKANFIAIASARSIDLRLWFIRIDEYHRLPCRHSAKHRHQRILLLPALCIRSEKQLRS